MPTLYVAISKTMQEWGADVGLGKNLFKMGIADGQTPEQAVAGMGGQDDWKILKTAETDLTEDEALARLGRKEKLVDPNYYPKLRGAPGIVKINLTAMKTPGWSPWRWKARPRPRARPSPPTSPPI